MNAITITGFEEIEILNNRLKALATPLIMAAMTEVDFTDMEAVLIASGEAVVEAAEKHPEITSEMNMVLAKYNTLSLPIPGNEEAVETVMEMVNQINAAGDAGVVWAAWGEVEKSKWAAASMVVGFNKDAMTMFLKEMANTLKDHMAAAVDAIEGDLTEETPVVH